MWQHSLSENELDMELYCMNTGLFCLVWTAENGKYFMVLQLHQ